MQPAYRLSVDGRQCTAHHARPCGSLGICAPGSGYHSQVPASVQPSRLSLEAAYPTGFAPVPFSEVLPPGRNVFSPISTLWLQKKKSPKRDDSLRGFLSCQRHRCIFSSQSVLLSSTNTANVPLIFVPCKFSRYFLQIILVFTDFTL